MIGVVSRALSKSGGVGVVEAPTGVGKSLGYLTAGVPIALASKKKLVISTGTVALQSQLVERDIPNFLKATGLEATVALAKGRTRYLCTRNAAEAQGEGSQGGMFEDDAPLFDRPLAPIEMDIAKRLTDAFTSGSWDGDIDNAPETISPGLRSRITTPASGCAGRRCAYSAQCAVLRSRNTVRDAIVVTNHALLLSALSIGDSDNGQPLIAPPSDMLLVLDEGHHIGNVAIDQGAASLALDEMAKRTGRLQILIAGAYRAVDKDRLATCCRTKRSKSPATWPSSCARSVITSSGCGCRRRRTKSRCGARPTGACPRPGASRSSAGRRYPQPLQLGACRHRAGGQGQAGRCRARAPAAQPGHGAGDDRAAVQPVAGLAPRGQGRRAADGALGHRHPRWRPGAARLAGVGRARAAQAAVG
jgi:hypothetical protein